MFGKKENLEMKNEFDFNELKAGMAIKVPYCEDSLLIGIPNNNDITFYDSYFDNVVRKNDIIKGCQENFMPIEIYGVSVCDKLFDPNTRPLLWIKTKNISKEKNINHKKYKIGDISIEPNYSFGYKTTKETERGIYINQSNENHFCAITVHESELDNIINALTEIRDFINEEE